MAVAAEEEEESSLLGWVLWLLVVAFLDDDEGGLQFRKEVQTLHGFPSGPRTIPGGRGDLVLPLPLLINCSSLGK